MIPAGPKLVYRLDVVSKMFLKRREEGEGSCGMSIMPGDSGGIRIPACIAWHRSRA
jgi:hypothetical protein